jgi:hypothetical protein
MDAFNVHVNSEKEVVITQIEKPSLERGQRLTTEHHHYSEH